VRARANLLNVELLSSFQDRRTYLVTLLVGTPHLQAVGASHAMVQRAYLASGDADRAHVEELDGGRGPAVELLDQPWSVRPLNLIPVQRAHDRLAHRPRRRAVIVGDFDVVSTCLGVEADPVRRRISSNENQL